MIIDMVSEHASPLAVLGGADAGGQNVHVAALAEALARRGHSLRVFTRRDGLKLPDQVQLSAGVTVEHVPAGPPRPVSKEELLPYMDGFARYLRRRWLTERPDLVHAHFWMSGLAALGGARRLGVPVAETFHALGSVKRRFQAAADTSPEERSWIEPMVGREARLIIATSSSEVQELCALGVRTDSTVVVPCGVDLERFRPEGVVAPRSARRRVLSIGRLVPRKGVDTLIQAMAAVPDAELVIAGGPAADELNQDSEVRRLRALAISLGIADRVVFLGRVPHEEAPALMRSADVVAGVPWYEPFGIVPVEAMACGVPVIASAVGGHLDTIVDGVTGLLVRARDPRGLARRLREMLDDPARRVAFGTAGAQRAREMYSWDRVAAETEAAYAGVLSARRRAGRQFAMVQGG